VTGLYAIVEPTPATPPLHNLIASAREVNETDNRWERGITWAPLGCVEPQVWDPRCQDGFPGGIDQDKGDAPENPDIAESWPVTLYTAFECNSRGQLSRDDEARVRGLLEAGTPKGTEKAFWSGAIGADVTPGANDTAFTLVTGTPNVDGNAPGATGGILNPDPVGAVTPLSPLQALASLQQALASCGPGGRGMIHATTHLAAIWAALDYLERDGGRLVTRVRGDIVVAGSGYDGTGPTDSSEADPTAGSVWAYATQMVTIRKAPIAIVPDGERKIMQALNRRTNTMRWTAERSVSWQVDPCCAFAALVDLP
jgi:hypothetical protein